MQAGLGLVTISTHPLLVLCFFVGLSIELGLAGGY